MIEKITEFYQTGIGQFVIVSLVFGLSCFVGYKIVSGIINKISKKINPSSLHWNILKQVIRVAFIVLYIICVVSNVPALSKLSTTLLACSSVIVAALGLASQDALGNAIDGLLISLFNPFAVGDKIRLVSKGITGVVSNINLRYTTICTVENNLLMIPNSVMNDEIIENYNIGDPRMKAFVDVEVGYGTDIEKAKQVMCDIATKHPLLIDMRSQEDIDNGKPIVPILVREFCASGINLRMTVSSADINDSFAICSDIREEILKRFREEGINIPYQTVTVIQENTNTQSEVKENITVAKNTSQKNKRK